MISNPDNASTRPAPAFTDREVAYFSMEIAFDTAVPTYAGGLGVLAGDTLRAAADLEIPMIGISLVHRRGYFRQRLDAFGRQAEQEDAWSPEERLEPVTARASVSIEGRDVAVGAWIHRIRSASGYEIPVVLLDTRLPENDEEAQRLTDELYGGDERYRLAQEVVLGMGGVEMLRLLGCERVQVHHLNEGHSALLALSLYEHAWGGRDARIETVRNQCVFTTHTPVPAGHDQFSAELVQRVLGPDNSRQLEELGCCLGGTLNMTYLGLMFSRYVNGVAMRHGQVSRGLFPGYPVASITNGVHASTWTASAFRALFDRSIPDWALQNDNLRYAVCLPLHEIEAAHRQCKAELLAEIEQRTGTRLEDDVLTLGFARRATPYKRADLLLSDLDRLREIARKGPLQIVYAGKAHPRDQAGKEIIARIFAAARQLQGEVPVVYLEDYDMRLGALMTAGVDVWVNTPHKPHEASGTSGMKAALNGVPSLSILDGWFIEGHVEGVTGWSVGNGWDGEAQLDAERVSLYRKLESIVELFYGHPDKFRRIMRHCIALNGSFFNAERMLQQYAQSAYRLRSRAR